MTQLEKMQHTTADNFLSPTYSHLQFYAETSEYDDGLLAFLDVRRNLFGIAYRMVGCAAEAEDIVQEVWLRWQATNRGVVLDPPAFLMTTTIRMCINLYHSARSRRETYIGEWFSEPVDGSADPSLGAERKEALRAAVLILLEKLRPTERAAYVLREAFDYSYRKIADILRMKEANVRQLLTRARKRIAEGRRAPVRSTERRRLLEALIDAAQNGKLAELEGLFASDAVCYSNAVRVALGNRGATTDRELSRAKFDVVSQNEGLFRSYRVRPAVVNTLDRNEDDNHEMEANSVSFLALHEFVRS